MSNAFGVAFNWVFLGVLLAATATRLWLARRQIRHVLAHRAAVPATFAESIPLAAHHKAADYTVAKARLGMVDITLGAVVLLAFTLAGGIQLLSDLWAGAFPAEARATIDSGAIAKTNTLPVLPTSCGA